MKREIVYAFEEAYQNESDAIYRFCLIRVSIREQALDIMQEAFLRLWQNMVAEKDILNKRAFLFTVAHNLVIDWYRKKKSLSLDGLMAMATESGGTYKLPAGAISDSLEKEAEGRYALEKINDLSPSYRDPVYLRYVEDMSPKEIGEILGISTNAASVRVNRGLALLREKTEGADLSKKEDRNGE